MLPITEFPTGTVTFVFTDLEWSTRLWEEHPDEMKAALARHDRILRDAIENQRGHVVKTMGDGVHAVFASAHDALAACLDAQRALVRERWPEETGPLQVRIGVHAGEAEYRDGDYYGTAVNRAARLMAVAHGGQVLVSESVEPLVRGELPTDAAFVDLGAHRLRDLADPLRVFQLAHPDLPGEFAPLRSLDTLPGNLPRQVTTFIGREREFEMLSELVCSRPLVTLTGVGGVGKTRLALQVAADVVPNFPDGAWFCELAAISDSAALWDALAATLGIPPRPGRSVDQGVLEYLAPKRMLLLLDNCEHVLDAAAGLVDAVSGQCPGVAILATSREGLALAGEQLVAVPSLGLPAEDLTGSAVAHTDAVRLFVERARDADRDFALTEHNASAVAQLCRRLDGIPLAIELAAARVRALPPQDLVHRLDQRFRLLTRGSRAALERHQTLHNTIDWSYGLLTRSERLALNGLSVFAGGCDLAAAEAVLSDVDLDTGDVADMLGQLVDKSLVVVDADEAAGTRYSLLETIRQYAEEHLETSGEAAALRRRHADHFVGVAADAGRRLRGPEQLVAGPAAAREVDNFRAALDWAVETGSADHALRLVVPLAVTGMAVGYAAMAWADAARSIPGAADHELFPVVVAWASWGKVVRGDYERGEALAAEAQRAQQRLGTRHLWVHMASATLAFFTGDIEGARSHAEEWVGLARPTGDAYELGHALVMLASAVHVADHDAGVAIAEEAVQVARDGSVDSALSISLTLLGSVLTSSDPDRAAVILEEALDRGRQVGDRHGMTHVALMHSWLAIRRGEWHAALRAVLDAAEAALGDVTMTPAMCGVASIALAHLQTPQPSAVLFGATQAAPFYPDDWREELARAEAVLIDSLGADRFAALRAHGAVMPPTDVVAYLRAEAARVLED